MFFLIFQIVDLDTKRNRNREALNALRNQMSDSGETPLDIHDVIYRYSYIVIGEISVRFLICKMYG